MLRGFIVRLPVASGLSGDCVPANIAPEAIYRSESDGQAARPASIEFYNRFSLLKI